MSNEKVSRTVTVTVVERPARKLIFLRHNATDYFTACEEVGCDIENYPFERFGWEKSDNAPYLGMGAEAETGARAAVPVRKYAERK